MLNGDSASYLGAACASEDPTLTHPLQPVDFCDFGRKGSEKTEVGTLKYIKLQKCFGPKQPNLGIETKVANMWNYVWRFL